MVSATRIFITGLGTILVILSVGVVIGYILTGVAKQPGAHEDPANSGSAASVRVILPNSAESAQGAEAKTTTIATPAPESQIPMQASVKQVGSPTEKPVVEGNTRKTGYLERRARYHKRNFKKGGPANSRHQYQLWASDRSPRSMTYDDDEPRVLGFFGRSE